MCCLIQNMCSLANDRMVSLFTFFALLTIFCVEWFSFSSHCSSVTSYCYFSQDINAIGVREVTTTIPLTEVPFIMRALGYFPTEQEVIMSMFVSAVN